jgi:hypothetical protein
MKGKRYTDEFKKEAVKQVTVVKNKALVIYMGILIYMINPLSIERRRAPLYTMNFIPFFQQELS